jgi:hypothetical protein
LDTFRRQDLTGMADAQSDYDMMDGGVDEVDEMDDKF